MKTRKTSATRIGRILTFAALIFIAGLITTRAQTSVFTYQGRFTDTTAAQPTNGSYTMTFRLFASIACSDQVAPEIVSMVSVVNGIFTVKLDFGAPPFNTSSLRYLEIQVGSTKLTPRQEITSTPFAVRAVNAATADSLSNQCDRCVTSAQIASVAGTKITGSVANADSATTAQNVSGVVAVANGGTGSSTQNFVDLTTAQTVGGIKTFNNDVNALTLIARSGGLVMNNNFIRLRDVSDNNHGIIYNSTIDGAEFRGFSGFRWTTGVNGATERMSLNSSGNLTVTNNISAGGTISGTLANNSVGAAQVTDGSLRLPDIAAVNQNFGGFGGVLGAHACSTISALPGTVSGLAVNDVVFLIPPDTSPNGFSFQPFYVTQTGTINFPVCNTLNTSNTLPPQTYRVFVLRP